MGKKREYFPIYTTLISAIIFFSAMHGAFSQFLYEQGKPSDGSGSYPPYVAYNIRAEKISGSGGGAIVTWDANPSYKGSFAVFKSTGVIDSAEKLRQASAVRISQLYGRNAAVDGTAQAEGSFYAVVAEERLSGNAELYAGVNYTIFSVYTDTTAKPTENTARNGISARLIQGGNILVQWDGAPGSGNTYTVYRSSAVIDSPGRLRESEKVTVTLDETAFVDQTMTSSGTYFYAVTVKPAGKEELIAMKAGENFTTAGVYFAGRDSGRTEDYYSVIAIRAKTVNEGVLLTWDYSGRRGNKFFKVYRTVRNVSSISELNDAEHIDDVEIIAGRFIDTDVPAGKFLYGLVPYDSNSLAGHNIVPGINFTIAGVGTEKKADDAENTAKGDVLIPDAGSFDVLPIIPDEYGSDSRQDDVSELEAVNRILRSSFFKGDFKKAKEQLGEYLKTGTQPRARAKARLFVARSQIETGDFRGAMTNLVYSDFKKYYSKEASFWFEFASMRLR